MTSYIILVLFVLAIVILYANTAVERLQIIFLSASAFLGLVLLTKFFGRILVNYELTESNIRIRIFGLPLVKINYFDIQEIKREPLWFFGFFSTIFIPSKMWGSVLIQRKRGLNFMITPDNPDAFIAEVRRRMQSTSSVNL